MWSTLIMLVNVFLQLEWDLLFEMLLVACVEPVARIRALNTIRRLWKDSYARWTWEPSCNDLALCVHTCDTCLNRVISLVPGCEWLFQFRQVVRTFMIKRLLITIVDELAFSRRCNNAIAREDALVREELLLTLSLVTVDRWDLFLVAHFVSTLLCDRVHILLAILLCVCVCFEWST